MYKILFSLLFTFNCYANYFIGVGYANLGDRYKYSKLLVSQYIGEFEVGEQYKLPINQYVDVEIPRRSSFGMSSALSGNAIVLNVGKQINFKNRFFYTTEISANYTGAKTRDEIVAIPEVDLGSMFVDNILSNKFITLSQIQEQISAIINPNQTFVGNLVVGTISSVLTGLLCNAEKDCSITEVNKDKIKPLIEGVLCPNGECKTPSKIVPITFRMSFNAGLISRIGYKFHNFDLNIITGSTLTIFDIINGDQKERVYKGRFIAGLGIEIPIGKNDSSRLYMDYKYYIPLSKNIKREYPDPLNPGKVSKIEIKDFGAETQIFEIGLKYYL